MTEANQTRPAVPGPESNPTSAKIPLVLRLPADLKGRIAALAKGNNRSLNSEIITRLNASLGTSIRSAGDQTIADGPDFLAQAVADASSTADMTKGQRQMTAQKKAKNEVSVIQLSKQAEEALAKMGGPASPSDRPGDWTDSAIAGPFGLDAVNELVQAELVKRGGTPSPVPASSHLHFRITCNVIMN